MSYPKHLYKSPGPYGIGAKSYTVTGAADEGEEAVLVARGWHATQEAAWAAIALDHDGDGKAGGSVKQSGADLSALRVEYQKIAGKKPFNGWDEATLRAKIAGLAQ